MLADGALWYRNLKNRDTQLAANWGYVYVYKKEGDSENIEGCDISLEEWATWADGIWHISNSGIGHTTPFAEELVRRIIKLWSMPNDTVLDPFAGGGTVNYVALQNNRNAIGIELKEEFYDLAIEKRFSKLSENDLIITDSKEQVTERFVKEKELAEQAKLEKQAEVEEKKQLTSKKKSIREEIKELESQLQALGMKKSEITKLKNQSKEG
jgi:site-specific DNA-methyltransferase (adenine-specific)